MTNHRFEPATEARFGNGRAPERPLGEVAAEIKKELKDFFQTRYAMLRAEAQEKASLLKMALPLMALGAVLAVGAFGVLTFALVAAVSLAFDGMRAPWALASLVVGGAYLLMGGIAAWVGWRALHREGMAPRRTLRVLQEDQEWLQREASQARSQS